MEASIVPKFNSAKFAKEGESPSAKPVSQQIRAQFEFAGTANLLLVSRFFRLGSRSPGMPFLPAPPRR